MFVKSHKWLAICKKNKQALRMILKKIQLNFLFMVSGILSDRMHTH